MWHKNVGRTFFPSVTLHACGRRSDARTDRRLSIPCVALHLVARQKWVLTSYLLKVLSSKVNRTLILITDSVMCMPLPYAPIFFFWGGGPNLLPTTDVLQAMAYKPQHWDGAQTEITSPIYYNKRGSTVNLCMSDISFSKAFDKVNHYCMFIKLMNRTPI